MVEPIHERDFMSVFTEKDRTFLTELRAITKDAQGREVLVGLTEQETAFYMEYSRRRLKGEGDPSGRDRYLELSEKHELARLSILGAEQQLRTENPSRH